MTNDISRLYFSSNKKGTKGGYDIYYVNLKDNASVQVAIYSVTGALLANKEYDQLSGGMLLPLDLGKYEAGMYFVQVTINGNTEIKKLIKE